LKNAILKPANKKRGLVKPENGSLKYADSFYWLKWFRHVFPHAQGAGYVRTDSRYCTCKTLLNPSLLFSQDKHNKRQQNKHK
jgi:hypothetical protein